jgi:uroporphyrinogen-III decarboxylase
MDRQYYLDLAKSGLRMPIGTHLVLHEQPDVAGILNDGRRLGEVILQTAARFRVPMALPLMDLTLEKEALLAGLGLEEDASTYHFTTPPQRELNFRLTPRMKATCEAIRHVAAHSKLLPVGMAIGPFSLMSKLVQDPITPVFLAGTGATAGEEPDVALIENLLELASATVRAYVAAQVDAGAKAVIVCEPAANKVYFSPNQLASSYEVFDRYVMRFNQRIAEQLRGQGADLIFHDCGELVEGIVRRFATLDPAILSLGSSRALWEDAALVPETTVLYGNLPTKQFYSDELLPLAKVRRLSDDLVRRMHDTGHPFILGSECDVLSVPGQETKIMAKVDEFLRAP